MPPVTSPNGATPSPVAPGPFDDVMVSGPEGAVVTGTDGKDTLIGGPGDDTLVGLGGDDDFVLRDDFGNLSIIGGETGEGPRGDLIDGRGLTEGVTLRYTGNEAGTITRDDGTEAEFREIENAYLGSGDDVVILDAASTGVVLGGEGRDTLVIPGLDSGDDDAPRVTITNTVTNDDGSVSNDGFVQFADGSVLTFRSFEEIVPCFTPGTLIDTDQGPRAVETLVPGDRVLTRDHGFRELVWTGAKALPGAALAAWPDLAPVRIAAGALGQGLPARDLMVSPRHRMLVSGPRAEVMFGEREVLVAAQDLLGLPGITRATDTGAAGTTYLHIMCEGHEIIRAEGAWTESFQPAAGVLSALDEGVRAELLRLFPELSTAQGQTRFAAARPVLSPAEAKLLVA